MGKCIIIDQELFSRYEFNESRKINHKRIVWMRAESKVSGVSPRHYYRNIPAIFVCIGYNLQLCLWKDIFCVQNRADLHPSLSEKKRRVEIGPSMSQKMKFFLSFYEEKRICPSVSGRGKKWMLCFSLGEKNESVSVSPPRRKKTNPSLCLLLGEKKTNSSLCLLLGEKNESVFVSPRRKKMNITLSLRNSFFVYYTLLGARGIYSGDAQS